MALPELEHHRVEKLLSKFCEQRIPPELRDEIKMIYRIFGNKVVLIESRPYFDDPTKWTEVPIAQFEYSTTAKSWSLYGFNRNSRRVPHSTGTLDKLIQDVEKDTTRIFWG